METLNFLAYSKPPMVVFYPSLVVGTFSVPRISLIVSGPFELFNGEMGHEILPLRMMPISILRINSKPGEGVHSGGWLSMVENANLLGVTNGCTNIHIVDSSVLPSIAAGPITFTVMANAMRIAKESQK